MISMLSSGGSPHEDSFASATTRWQRVRRLRPGDLLLGCAALIVLPLAGPGLRRWGLQGAQLRLSAWQPKRRRPVPAHLALDAALRVAWVVEVAERRGIYRPNCLQRSLALWWFLGMRGIASEVRIGVRRRPGSPSGASTLDFHAWVEYGGIVLNDVADVRERFATFPKAIAPVNMRWD